MLAQRSPLACVLATVAVLAVLHGVVLTEDLAFAASSLVHHVLAPSEALTGPADYMARITPGTTHLSTLRSGDAAGALNALGDFTEEAPIQPSSGRSARPLLSGLAGLVGLALAARQGRSLRRKLSRGAETLPTSKVAEEDGVKQAITVFCNLFAVWLAIAAVAGVKYPPSFTWVKPSYFTGLLGMLMFSVGITTTIDDFKECLSRPGAVAINFFACYGIMPVLAFILAKAIGAEGAILAGMVLVGSVNGGQASNLCTLIAGGDVALSVLMTTSTTLGCILMTPLICKLMLGAVVPIDAWGIVISTIQVVLAPIFVGVGLNTVAPDVCKKVAPYTPVVGVIATVLLVGASVAGCAKPILSAGLPLQLACLGLHLFGGVLGFFATKLANYDERTCRTVAIETAMKSSAFGFLLASLHFGSFNARVPAAVSVVWMAIVGSVLAVYWKAKPVTA